MNYRLRDKIKAIQANVSVTMETRFSNTEGFGVKREIRGPRTIVN